MANVTRKTVRKYWAPQNSPPWHVSSMLEIGWNYSDKLTSKFTAMTHTFEVAREMLEKNKRIGNRNKKSTYYNIHDVPRNCPQLIQTSK